MWSIEIEIITVHQVHQFHLNREASTYDGHLQSPKTKKLADELIKKTSSMLDEIESKTMHKAEEGNQ